MYDVNYFIKKFEAIPEDEWCEGSYRNGYGTQRCALGHCGEYNTSTKESMALSNVLNYDAVIMVNDGDNLNYTQPTPKQRILAALYDIRDKELSEANVKEASKLINEVENEENYLLV